nr:11716_t:CDS:2 [Entrophospora candida]CAG8518889.1 11710_t:CDS:2 [Entrophospora candida]
MEMNIDNDDTVTNQTENLDQSLATLTKRKIETEECLSPNKRLREILVSTSTIGKIITSDKISENIHIQESTCNNKKYTIFDRCQPCVNKKVDKCRFQNFRYFYINPITDEIMEGSNFISDLNPASILKSREIPLNQEDSQYILDLIAPTFKTILQREFSHIDKAVCRKNPEANIRQLCDNCQHTIFSGFWICIVCGREICIECYDEWDELSPKTFGTVGKCSLKRRHEKRHMLGVCFYQRSEIEKLYKETCKILNVDDTIPIFNENNPELINDPSNPATTLIAMESPEYTNSLKSEISKSMELIEPIKPMELIEPTKHTESFGPIELSKSIESIEFTPTIINPEPTQQLLLLNEQNNDSIITEEKTIKNSDTIPTPIIADDNDNSNDNDGLNELKDIDSEIYDNSHESHNQLEWNNGEMTIEQFREFWKKGYPFVIRNLKYEDQFWNPNYLSKRYGNTPCDTIDCKTDKIFHTTVREFFDGFVNLEKRPKYRRNITCLKLKDWPSNQDFARKFPDHFKDFMSTMPFPQYSTRNGNMNLVNQLPREYIVPDLGPKMYNAYGSEDGLKGVGTTRLHLDVTDAVNLMTYAPGIHERLPDEQLKPAAAVWDLYHVNDLPKIRKFLHGYTNKIGLRIDDPIHDQCYYLNETLKEMLLQEQGVKGWRIYQNPGDMIFIPAGCAHQVCNYTACVKVAVDFVSPEGVVRSYNVSKEFRRLSRNHARRGDILQLPNILLHAWNSIYQNYTQGQQDDDQNQN